jgi:hypothetical protein
MHRAAIVIAAVQHYDLMLNFATNVGQNGESNQWSVDSGQ